jgi:H+/Cl- antiporter ClcA
VANLASIIKIIAVLAAAMLIGNWFLAELKVARSKGRPWYTPYLSIPGLLIILALVLPVIIWILNK